MWWRGWRGSEVGTKEYSFLVVQQSLFVVQFGPVGLPSPRYAVELPFFGPGTTDVERTCLCLAQNGGKYARH